MMTSNFSAEAAKDATASKTTNAKRKRLFITDLFYLKRLFARRKFETNPLASFPVQKRFRDRRHPADPIIFGIGFIDADDAITGLVIVRFPNRHVRAETDDI